MSDLVKVRQLHDWLIRHCQYEDFKNGEKISDPENQNCSGVFVSYGLNTRGTGIGETVCTGYSKAYQKLLAKCGNSSEILSIAGKNTVTGEKLHHAWNLVKIGSVYYHCDVTQDNNLTDGSNMAFGTNYSCFMKSNKDRILAHLSVNAYYNQVQEETTASALAALNNCAPVSIHDDNTDGILDGDWNLDGTANRNNNDYYRALVVKLHEYGYDSAVLDFMPVYIWFL